MTISAVNKFHKIKPLANSFITILIFAGLLSSAKAAENRSENSISPSVTNADEAEANAEEKVRTVIFKNKLTSVKPECLSVELDEKESEVIWLFSAYEIHTEKCGGDPETKPRLFSVRIDIKTDKTWSDALSEDGEFETLQK